MEKWRTYLKVYYAVMLGLFVLGIGGGVEEPLDVVNAIITGFVFVGVYGFLARVPIATRGFWQFYFGLFVVSSVVTLLMGAWSLRHEMTVGLILFLMFVAALWLPMFMAIWLYAFVDSHPWKNPEPET